MKYYPHFALLQTIENSPIDDYEGSYPYPGDGGLPQVQPVAVKGQFLFITVTIHVYIERATHTIAL